MPLTLEWLVRQEDKFKTFTKPSLLSRSQGTDMNQMQSLLHKEQTANKKQLQCSLSHAMIGAVGAQRRGR